MLVHRDTVYAEFKGQGHKFIGQSSRSQENNKISATAWVADRD